MRHIVFLDRETLAPEIRLRRPDFAHEFTAYGHTAREEVVERLRGADIAIVNKVQVREDALAQLPGLRMIAVAATGTDCVDVAWCREHGVAVSNVRGYSVNTVPEHVFALMLALKRSIVPYRADVLAGAWQRSGQFCFFSHPIGDLAGKVLGIVGNGTLGRKVAALGEAFGMKPVFAGRKGRASVNIPYVPWDEMLATADVITVHCPLTPETRGLVDMAEFRKMARRPVLINTARGGIVLEEDLEEALEAGLISGAGIDVTMPEPPPSDSLIMRIARRTNVIVTPHVAWASAEAQQTVADQTILNIENYVAGRPTNLVT